MSGFIKIKYFVFCIFCLILIPSCRKYCDESLRLGEKVQIPIEFEGFSLSEINGILVYRIDRTNKSKIDTFLMKQILWAGEARSSKEVITDNPKSNLSDNFGNYDSYFDQCDLVFDWHTKRDTLSDFKIKKSKDNTDGCHKNDPNVRIDQLSFMHKGILINKHEGITIKK